MTDIELTKRQRDILQHSLTGAQKDLKTVFRNRFYTSPLCDGFPDVSALVAAGLMVKGMGYASLYHVTDAGMRAIGIDPEKVDSEDRV